MKHLLISLCAASLMAASAIGYAETVTLVNKYNQPVTFAVSKGVVYNPVVLGTVGAGERMTATIDGPVTPEHYFMVYPPHSTNNVVTSCGNYYEVMNNVVVKAGWSKYTGMFSCRLYEVKKPCPKHHK